MELRDELSSALPQLSEEQTLKFIKYYEILTEWNDRMNLTAITSPRDFAVKHISDSLAAFGDEFIPGAKVVDVGTGAGFPGIPLKIFCPEIKISLLDSLQKRTEFLKNAVSHIGLIDVDIVNARAEDAAKGEMRGAFDVVVARAVAPLSVLSEYALPFAVDGGIFIALKGAKYHEEIENAKKAVKILGGTIISANEIKLPGLPDTRAVIRIKKIAPTPGKYPRKAGTPTKKPL